MGLFLWDKENKYIAKLKDGVVLYKKLKRNRFVRRFKNTILNRRLETKRVRTHNKK